LNPIRAVAVSITHPVAVAAVSQPSHISARCGASLNNAATSGTNSTVATARATTETNASTVYATTLPRRSAGTRLNQVRIIAPPPELW
jgi:hypothetical protein